MNNIVSIGIFLFGLGYCIQSIATAMALPQGPSVSMGSNPVDSFYGSNGNATLLAQLKLRFHLNNRFEQQHKLSSSSQWKRCEQYQ